MPKATVLKSTSINGVQHEPGAVIEVAHEATHANLTRKGHLGPANIDEMLAQAPADMDEKMAQDQENAERVLPNAAKAKSDSSKNSAARKK